MVGEPPQVGLVGAYELLERVQVAAAGASERPRVRVLHRLPLGPTGQASLARPSVPVAGRGTALGGRFLHRTDRLRPAVVPSSPRAAGSHAGSGRAAALHGFVSLEALGGFGLPRRVGRSFARLVQILDAALRSWGQR
ncbi:MAG TPA: TetR-like C-terminal domain-containing protein [Actinomycetota bacterium]|nr:TetR-like C-terminal domain-containing protein [Actinomycetota bacterium]